MTDVLDRLARLVVGRVSAWLVLVACLLAGGVLIGLGAMAESSGEPPNPLPDDAESAQVSELAQGFPGGDLMPAIAIVARDGDPLGDADKRYLEDLSREWKQVVAGRVTGPIPSEDGEAAVYTIPVPAQNAGSAMKSTVQQLRAAVVDPPDGLTVQITGGAAFAADISSAFDGADLRLLLVTAGVVAVLLILTYRSPVLWLIPLTVIAVADRAAASLTEMVAQWTGGSLDGSTAGITSVLVFGAGTNYALLLVSRYREELRRHEDHREAMAAAVRGAVPAIVASNMTVVLALLMLLFSVAPNSQSLGRSAAVGLLLALFFALFALPAALTICGRRLFWPFVPHPGEDEKSTRGVWFSIARSVVKRPLAVLTASVLLLGVLASGLFGIKVGLAQTEQFRVQAESVDGLETLSEHFPAGAADPVTVIAEGNRTVQVLSALRGAEGVATAEPAGRSDSGLVKITASLEAAPSSPESLDTIRALRIELSAIEGGNALVGGSVAQQLDARDGAERDLRVVVPLILMMVLLVLFAVLRTVVTPLVLLMINILSTAAALGAGVWVSEHVFGFPALDVATPLYVVLFLVALGIDYTIFLVLRAREERSGHGTVEGMVRSVGLTGGVITSAGIVLAAVFAVLGVLPLITLTQVGVIVGLGILLDTFLVRTIVVPAVFEALGDRIWWPSKQR